MHEQTAEILVARGQGRKGDTRRTQLLEAMAALLRKGVLPDTMADLAKVAGMSPATAYRYFPSLADVAQAYVANIMGELRDFSSARTETSFELLRLISRFWVDLVIEHGPVLVQIRSRKGFFERLHSNVPSTVRGYEARAKALEQVLAEMGLSEAMKDDAAMLYNTMFDPRDIMDLLNLREMGADVVTDVLVSSFVGALRGWHEGITNVRGQPQVQPLEEDRRTR